MDEELDRQIDDELEDVSEYLRYIPLTELQLLNFNTEKEKVDIGQQCNFQNESQSPNNQFQVRIAATTPDEETNTSSYLKQNESNCERTPLEGQLIPQVCTSNVAQASDTYCSWYKGCPDAQNVNQTTSGNTSGKYLPQNIQNKDASINTQVRPFLCEVCGKSFKYRSHLTDHGRVHSKEKPFKCELCDKCFTKKCNLNSHKVVHTKEKPFKCELCGKYFTQKSNLNLHKVIHTKERPFQCDLCGKFFTQKSSLNRHGVIHTKERPFQC